LTSRIAGASSPASSRSGHVLERGLGQLEPLAEPRVARGGAGGVVVGAIDGGAQRVGRHAHRTDRAAEDEAQVVERGEGGARVGDRDAQAVRAVGEGQHEVAARPLHRHRREQRARRQRRRHRPARQRAHGASVGGAPGSS
jgi:hypothetical protein